MQFHRNNTGGSNKLALHKSEWNRLKKQAVPPENPSKLENEHIKSMIEKSQAWIKTWPDTVQGCVAQIKKQKENQRAQELAAVKAFVKEKVNKNTTEAIEKAKQRIFDESCYGKKLLSALLESKALEERDAQIQFKKEMQEKEAEIEQKQRKTLNFCSFGLDKNARAKEEEQRCLKVQNSRENKAMYEKQKADEAKTKEEEKLTDLEDAQFMKYLLNREQEAEDNIKLLERQSLEQYATDHKKAKEERAKREAEYYSKIEQCRKEQEILNCKIKQVLQRINKETQDPVMKKNNYDKIKKCQEDEKIRYDTFIEKNSKREEDRAAKREKTKDKEQQDRDKKVSIAEFNKTLAEYVVQRQCSNKCFCDRQCFIVKSERERKMKRGNDDIKIKPKEIRPYFGPCNKLVAALKQREKEPTPWTGAGSAHVLFKRNADDILRECKYKMSARKVVDEYRKYNGLNADTLPIPNY